MTTTTHYFEDIPVGDTAVFGAYEVTTAEIEWFAGRYDPLPSPPLAVLDGDGDDAPGPAASGWHVATLCMCITHGWTGYQGSSLAGVGLDRIRWHQRVYAGDTLHLRTAVLAKRPSDSRPDRGYTRSRWEARNQDDDVVLSLVLEELWPRRTTDEDATESDE